MHVILLVLKTTTKPKTKMGIRCLNKFLQDNCTKKSIYKIELSELQGKTVVVDTSIYMYKFISEDALLENMYLFISILKKYEIHPIFIFDGKPPVEKYELLKQRQLKKKEAENKYNKLHDCMADALDDNHRKDIEYEMSYLKRQFTRLRDEDIQSVKELMDAYGVEYYVSPREADELCAYFMQSGKAWACFTDDMDMFIYDCPYVVRNISLMNHTAFMYDKNSILKELKINQKLFREIMILSGTDYNISTNTSLKETIKWFHKYNKYLLDCSEEKNGAKKPFEFYVWLVKTTKYITDYSVLLKIYKMFIIDNEFQEIEDKMKNHVVKSVDALRLKTILKNEGFVFL